MPELILGSFVGLLIGAFVSCQVVSRKRSKEIERLTQVARSTERELAAQKERLAAVDRSKSDKQSAEEKNIDDLKVLLRRADRALVQARSRRGEQDTEITRLKSRLELLETEQVDDEQEIDLTAEAEDHQHQS